MIIKPVRAIIIFISLIFICNMVFSQENQIPVRDDKFIRKPPQEEEHKFDLGVGFGLDYGGLLGVQAGFIPLKHLVLFGTAGYYVIGFGWQAGLKGMFLPETAKHVFRPFLKASYGTNSIIIVDGTDKYDKIYTGFTVGFGMEFRFGKKKKNGFDIDLNVPLRSPDFWDDFNAMKNDPTLEITMEPIPVAYSIGFHHEF
jgi:hypothetical protein